MLVQCLVCLFCLWVDFYFPLKGGHEVLKQRQLREKVFSDAAWGVGKGMLSGVPGLVSRFWWACTPALWTSQVVLSFVYPIRWDRITRVSQGWAVPFPRSVRLRWASLGGRPCYGEQNALAYLKMVLSPPTQQNGKGTFLQYSLGGPGRVSG